MPKILSSKEKDEKLEVSRQMFLVGRKVKVGLVGQIVFWNNEKNFGFIRTHEMDTSEDSYYCNGSAFRSECSVKDIVKFDVWQNNETDSQKAVNVCFLQHATSVIETDKIGMLTKWFGPKGIINLDGKEYRCSQDDFEKKFVPPCNSRVCFDIIKDNWNSTETKVHTKAANIRVAKQVRYVHLAGVEGRVKTMNRSYGFVSTKLIDHDIYFNGTEHARVHSQKIRHTDRITFDVIMEKDGSLTAENIKVRMDLVKSHQLAANARQLAADFCSLPVKPKIVERDAQEKLCEAEKRASEYHRKRDAEARAKAKSTLAETKDDASTAASEAAEDDRKAPAPAVDNDWKAPAPGVDDDWKAPAPAVEAVGDWKAQAPTMEAADDDSAAQKVAAMDDSVKEVRAVDDDCASTAASDLPSSTPAFKDWSKEDVSKWLQGVSLDSYVPIFQDNYVDGEILSDLRGAGTDEMKRMLQEDLKVKSIHLKRFERCLNDLA